MCGIVGIVSRDPHERVNPARLERMRDALAHRGPDEAGAVVDGQAGLGHRRLSIIDLAGGRQPMANADASVWITYNGEVYNFRELRAQLEARGCAFTTRSDTEVVLRAYEVFGEECVGQLRGMFAFAIWDRRQRKVFLARDRLGIKPLYYALTRDELLFASEIKAILAAGRVRPAFNRAVLPEFLATRFVAGSETFFSGIRKLLPGHVLSWSPPGAGARERPYWRLPPVIDDAARPLGERARELRGRLEEVVRGHLVSDVPLGVFLSGGIDSTGLAALMAPMVAGPLQTFAVGFDDPASNELGYARLAAGAIGAIHREVVVSEAEYFDALPRLVWHEDEPIAFPSSVPLYFVSRLAREHVKVVMTGEGADELFLGYNRYRVTAWNERLGRLYRAALPAGARERVRRWVGRLPWPLQRYAARSFVARGGGVREGFYENFAVFPEALQRDVLADPGLLATRDPYAAGLRCYDAAPGAALERMGHADLQTYLVELLMKQDQMSMAASLESRVPFLDHELVEHAAAMPGRYKVRGWQTKVVLREALRNLVPRAILTRPKMGFPTPVGRWLRQASAPLLREFVCGGRAGERGLLEPRGVARLVEEHRRGARDHGERLWLLLNLEIWQRIFIDGEPAARVMDAVAPAATSRAPDLAGAAVG
jgi:asparagine synthase (glutamine-hydrolysing)